MRSRLLAGLEEILKHDSVRKELKSLAFLLLSMIVTQTIRAIGIIWDNPTTPYARNHPRGG